MDDPRDLDLEHQRRLRAERVLTICASCGAMTYPQDPMANWLSSSTPSLWTTITEPTTK